MATALLEEDIKRHATAVMVVLDIYPRIMREIICNKWSPKYVVMLIQNEEDQKFMNNLNFLEKKMILEMDRNGYNNLDISCLYKVIRHFNLLPPPKQRWGQQPNAKDLGESDDVERMKRYRNDVLHRPRGGLSESDNKTFFQQSVDIAKRMDSRIGYPKNGFESGITKVQSNIVSKEKYIEAIEKCAEYRARLQETEDSQSFDLYYGNDIKIKIKAQDEDETNVASSSLCTIYLKDPNFDENDVIQMLDATKEKIRTGDYAISLEEAESGSLNLHVSIHHRCFMTNEILHKSIQSFLYEFFLAASIPFTQGHIYTIVLAESIDLVSDNELTKQEDVDYLKEQLPSILKLNVKVKDSAFQNENVLYREVNRFVSGVYNTLNKYTDSLNGSSREVFMLTANEGDENCTPSLKSNVDPPQLRTAQVPVIGEEDSNYFKISTLLLRIAPRAVKIKFDDEFRPEVLTETLNSNKSVIADMKNKRLINQVQWNSMFPRKGDPVSQLFDTTLMICLLGNLKGIKISDDLPHQTDYSVGAYLSRINIYRKDIANLNDDKIKNEKFAACWSDTETAVVRLSGGKLKEECSNLKTKSYVCADRKTTLNNIQAGKRLVQIEVAKRVEKIDNNQDSIIKETQEWEEESKWFVQTKAFTFIIRHVDQRVLTVVGNQGMGKSMLLHQTALFLKMKKGYSIFSCQGPSELVSQHRANTKQVFIFDNACGQFTLVQSNVDQWKQYETRIAKIVESEQVIIISSCRSNMFIDKQCQSLLIFSGCRCDLNDGEYAIDIQEKITIAKNYLSQLTISEVQSDLDSFDMFPLLCRLYKERVAWNAINFFHDPFSFYKEEMNGFYKEDGGIRCCSLFLCVINNGCLDQTILMDESESVIWPKFKKVFAEFGLKPDLSRKSVIDSLDTLVNIYLKKRDDEFHILHDILFDFLCYYFGERHQQLMMNYADSRMIRDRTLIDTSQTSSQEFTIIIERQNESDYIQRLVKDMLSGYLDDVLYNHQIRYEHFRLKLLAHLQELDDNDLAVTNVFSDFVIDESEKPSPLIPVDFACKYGYRELFEFFLSKTKNINAYEGNNIPLITACRKGDKYMTGLLLEKGADVNQTDALGGSPLLWSCVYGYTSMVSLLLNKEANVNASNRVGDTPLIMASMNGHTTIVRLLIARKADMYKSNKKGECALIVACKNNHLEIVKVLIDNGCNIECTEKKKKQTCLYVASYHGYENIVAFLIDHGADVNTQTYEGNTPLKLATANSHFNIVKMLIEHKANINFRDEEGSTPVSGAICSGNNEIVAYLIEHEANVNTKDLKDFTPLMLAASKGHYNIVKMLVENKADITPQDAEGSTCVSEASFHGNDAILAYFIEHEADVNIPNKKGNTPLMLAASEGNLNIVRILLKHQAGVTIWDEKGLKNKLLFLIHERAINKANNTGNSSLMLASKNGHASIVQMLLNNGANMHMKNKEGMSSISLAKQYGHFEVKAILRRNIPYSYSFSDNSFMYLADLFKCILVLYFFKHVCDMLDL